MHSAVQCMWVSGLCERHASLVFISTIRTTQALTKGDAGEAPASRQPCKTVGESLGQQRGFPPVGRRTVYESSFAVEPCSRHATVMPYCVNSTAVRMLLSTSRVLLMRFATSAAQGRQQHPQTLKHSTALSACCCAGTRNRVALWSAAACRHARLQVPT